MTENMAEKLQEAALFLARVQAGREPMNMSAPTEFETKGPVRVYTVNANRQSVDEMVAIFREAERDGFKPRIATRGVVIVMEKI